MTRKPGIFYGWIVIVIGFFSVSMFGVIYSYGTFIAPLENYLKASRTALSAGYTIEMIFYSIFAVVMGWLFDRYGPRITLWLAALLMGGGLALCSTVGSLWQLYLFFGIIAGMGHGAVFVVPTSTVTRWFIKKRGLAVGITACGLGFGLLVVPPISEHLIRVYSWQTAFLCLGALAFFVNVTVGLLLRRRPEDLGLQPLGAGEEIPIATRPSTRDFPLEEILKAPVFWVVYFTSVFCYGAEQMLVVHIVPYCGTIGITAAQASLGLSFLGVGTIAGRVAIGALSDRIGRIPALMISCAMQAITTFGVLTVNGPGVLYAVMLLVGFGYGGWAVLNVVVLGDHFGTKNLGKAMGFYFTAGVPAGLLGPLLGGAIYDSTRSYFFAIILAGVISAIPVVLAYSIRSRKPLPAG